MLPGVDDEMREFGQSGIKCHERELLTAITYSKGEVTRPWRKEADKVCHSICHVFEDVGEPSAPGPSTATHGPSTILIARALRSKS
jgi:hypothetical protein